MSEKIKINSIKIKNYRQYYGDEHNIEFSNRNDGFSVIIGENGAGKSNLLNAINWCLYKKEPHTKKNKGYSIINKKYLESIKNGNIANMTVQIELQKGNDQYRISRILKVIKNDYQYKEIDSGEKILEMTEASGHPLPIGCEVIEEQSTFEILVKRKEEQDFHFDKTANASILMNEILPESLAPYFILDGEFLEKFWSGVHKVQIGVEQISQLHVLTTTIEHLNKLRRNVPKIGDKEIDNLTTKIRLNEYEERSEDEDGNIKFSSEPRYAYDAEIDKNEFYHAAGNPRMGDLQDDIEKMVKAQNKITEEFSTSNIEAVKLLNEDLKQTNDEHEKLSQNVDQKRKIYFSSIIEHLPLWFLKPGIEYTIKLVDELREKGDLPYEAKKIFTNDLLDRGTCICHTDLKSKRVDGKELNSARAQVIKIRDNMAEDQGLDGGIDMKFYFDEKLLGNFDKFTKTFFDDPRKDYHNIKNQYRKCDEKLKGIKIKLQNVGNQNTVKLIENHDYLSKFIREKTKESKDIEYRLKENKKTTNIHEAKRSKLLVKNKNTRKIAHRQKIWVTISQILEKTYDELKQEIKDEVQTKTMDIFLETMYKENLFKKFIIKNNFEVELIDKENNPVLGSLSAGESLFLALSFISAIRNVTGFKFPLIIDTPLGRVSGRPRYLLSQALPKYLPNEQIIFLATDTEFTHHDSNAKEEKGMQGLAFGQLLEKQIKVKYYKIVDEEEQNTAKIVDYTPKWSRN